MNASCTQRHAQAIVSIARHVVSSARDGQLLPRLTLLLGWHLLFHATLFNFATWSPLLWKNVLLSKESVRQISMTLLVTNLLLNLASYTLLYKLYRHSVSTIFNKVPPEYPSPEFATSFGAHLAMLKPIEILFRYVTASFRVLPDVVVLGEVRCGTTTLCHHLRNHIRSDDGRHNYCHPPFCLWKHPELDHKETFYFVGHYLGSVDPSNYRMCFPLQLTKWWHERILKRPFLTFDGCAQYLTSPTTAKLLAEAYCKAGQDPPVLVVCVRDPVDQAYSWWKYENAAMEWGSNSMGLGVSPWNSNVRGNDYPPRTFKDALEWSSSEQVRKLYKDAEDLVKRSSSSGFSVGASQQQHALAREHGYTIPEWAMTWPGGQLGSIGRNGRFAENIERYEWVFANVFESRKVALARKGRRWKHVSVVIPIEHLSNPTRLRETLVSIVHKVAARRYRQSENNNNSSRGKDNQETPKVVRMQPIVKMRNDLVRACKSSLDRRFQDNNNIMIQRNASATTAESTNPIMEVTRKDRIMLAKIVAEDTQRLACLANLDVEKLGWKTLDLASKE